MSLSSLTGWNLAVDREDRYTKRHSDLVTAAVRFARTLGLPAARLAAVAIAGPLPFVEKITGPDAIRRKPGRLMANQRAVIERHVEFGVLMVQGVPHQDAVRAAIAFHHERWDGTGYPHGARGPAIPVLGRMMALADAHAAMISDLPDRKGPTPAAVIAELRRGGGSQFDPGLVEPIVASLPAAGDRAGPPGRSSPEAAVLVLASVLPRTVPDGIVMEA